MHKEDDTQDEGARPSSLRSVHKLSTPDPLYDQQLLRDVEIINARTRAEFGPPPPIDTNTPVRRKPRLPSRVQLDGMVLASACPKSPSGRQPTIVTMPATQEIDPVKPKDVALMMGLSAASVVVPMAFGNAVDEDHESSHGTYRDQIHGPVWPNNGIAERELGDGKDTWPENMFVEHSDGRWIVWVLLSPVHGQAKALDFFSGEVVLAKVNHPGDYNDSFIDAHGVAHRSAVHPAFDYKDPRPGGGLAGIDFSASYLRFGTRPPCSSYDLNVSRRVANDSDTVSWSKVLLYRTPGCKVGVWESFINTALDLGDGTLLITGGKYIFRINRADMTPVGEALNLRVVNEVDVRRAIDDAQGKQIEDGSAYLSEMLHLN